MRFRATQLGRRLQRGHTLQRRCYVAAHSTQGTLRTSPGGGGAAEGGCRPIPPHFFALAQRNGVEPQRKSALVLNQPNHAVIWLSAYRQWELSQRVLVHRRPRRRGFHIPRFRTSPKARSLHRSSSLPEKHASLAGTKSLRVPLTGGEYNLAVPLVNLALAFGKGGAAELYFRSR